MMRGQSSTVEGNANELCVAPEHFDCAQMAPVPCHRVLRSDQLQKTADGQPVRAK